MKHWEVWCDMDFGMWRAQRAVRSAAKAVDGEISRVRQLMQASYTNNISQMSPEVAKALNKANNALEKLARLAANLTELGQKRASTPALIGAVAKLRLGTQGAQRQTLQTKQLLQQTNPVLPTAALTPSTGEFHLILERMTNAQIDIMNSVQLIKDSVEAEEQKQAEERRLALQQRKYLAQFGGIDPMEVLQQVQSGRFPPVSANIVLRANEIPLFATQATLAEDKTTTQRLGNSLGYSFPVGHGIRFRVSSYQGRSISTTSLTKQDSGVLVIASQRIVFTGGRETVVMPTQKIVNTIIHYNGVDVRVENRQKREVFLCRNPRLVNAYVLIATQLTSS